MVIFDKLYKLILAYLAVIALTILQLPSYAPAMRDFSLEVTLVVIVLYLFKINGNKYEYWIAIILYVVLSLIVNENILEIILDLAGLFIFNKIYRPHHLIKTVYFIVIMLTILAYVITPLILPRDIFDNSYIAIILSVNYFKYIITIFPAYLIFEWALNGIIIEYIHFKKKLT